MAVASPRRAASREASLLFVGFASARRVGLVTSVPVPATAEQQAREAIDEALVAAGWLVQKTDAANLENLRAALQQFETIQADLSRVTR